MIVVADPDASEDEKYELVRIIRRALAVEHPDRYFRLFSSSDRDLTLLDMTSH